ncbi:HD domain-containing protein [Patescibacteria group bacterium]|nr:HD domain-containing protein [Patescibacteria group bacterium]
MIIKDKIWGKIEIKDELVEKIIKDNDFQRLKNISQCGVFKHCYLSNIELSRYEHSIGVYYLLREFGARKDECIAGLLHDISHGVFSHVLDLIFVNDGNEEFADDILSEKISDSTIGDILRQNGYNLDKIINNKKHTLLDQELPDIAADRIDYTLRDPLGMNVQLSKMVINSLKIIKEEFVFDNSFIANIFSQQYYVLNNEFWSSAFWTVNHKILAQIIKKSLEKNYITKEDLFSLNDRQVTRIIEEKKDKDISKLIKKIRNLDYHKIEIVGKGEEFDYSWKKKNRFIDPKILISRKIKKLSDINLDWKLKLEYFKKNPYFEYKVKLR